VNPYELMLMLDPELPGRRLAYEIDKKSEATYHLLQFDCDPTTLEELTRILKITDGAMRHMAVRRPVGRRTSAAVPAPAPEPAGAAE
jgi:small subunit ribosomal protein S6